MNEENKIILYQDDNEITRVSVRFSDDDLWLTQNQLADIYCTTQENISMHVKNIYADRELDENRTYKKILLVRQEGNRQVKRNIDHYNLDMVIALGYRVQSQVKTYHSFLFIENKKLTKVVSLTGNDIETSELLYSAMFCTNQKNAFPICKSSIFIFYRQNYSSEK